MKDIQVALDRLLALARDAEHADTYEYCTGNPHGGLRVEGEETPEDILRRERAAFLVLVQSRLD